MILWVTCGFFDLANSADLDWAISCNFGQLVDKLIAGWSRMASVTYMGIRRLLARRQSILSPLSSSQLACTSSHGISVPKQQEGTSTSQVSAHITFAIVPLAHPRDPEEESISQHGERERWIHWGHQCIHLPQRGYVTYLRSHSL